MDDFDYFGGATQYTFNAKVISMGCTLFTIKKSNLDRILKENPTINDFLVSKWKVRHDFLSQRLEKYVDLRFQNQLKLPDMYGLICSLPDKTSSRMDTLSPTTRASTRPSNCPPPRLWKSPI